MAAKDACDFFIFHSSINCSNSDTFSLIQKLPVNLANILLTESGLLLTKFTENRFICKSHILHVQEKNRSRQRLKCCSIPNHIAIHATKNQKRRGKLRASRPLTTDQVLEINKKYGTVLPVGTPICSSCRKNLFQHDDLEEEKDNEEEEEDHIENGEDRTGLFLRPRTEIHYTENDSKDQSSQELLSSQGLLSSQESHVSEASVTNVDRLKKLNEFLDMCNSSPVKTLREPYSISSHRTKRRYAAKANECLTLLLETMCPGESDVMKDDMFSRVEKNYSCTDSPEYIEALTESYLRAETSSVRRQLLSILTGYYSFQDLHDKIPSVTYHKYYSAKKHGKEVGIGAPLPQTKQRRERVNESKLEHFLDFITSSNVIKDLPLGEKTLTLTTGELIHVPYVIRSLAPATIVRHYSQLCQEENFEPIGESTMYQIMSECSAAMRKSVEGVDYYIAEASEAFHDLEDLVEKIQMSQDTRSKLLQSLMQAKHYLKTDYKMHVKASSNVADHCFVFALSEQKSENFAEECPHDHNHKCQQCDQLEETLSEIKRLTANMEWENPEAYLFQVEKSIKAVKELKGHILRSKNQEGARSDITGNLQEGEMFVVADWAMKFLPRKFREGQTDWFGKRGINWHITVCATKPKDQYVLDTYVHLLDSQAPQDSQLTSALIIDAIKDMVLSRNITDVHLWSDNAGCYKSTYTMYALHQELKELKTYNFCEAQDGKGPCDRKASHIKSAIKRFVNEGNNVLDASDMKKAIDTMQKGQYKVKIVTPVIDVEADKIKPIPCISLMHNFEFLPEGLKVWRAYNVGTGKLIPWRNCKATIIQLNIVQNWSPDTHSAFLPTDDNSDQDESEEPTPKRNKKTSQEEFQCSNDQCDRLFKSVSALENHLIIGDCKSRSEKLLVDRCKVLYQKRLDVNFSGSRTLNSETKVTDVDNFEDVGWALKTKKPKSHFTDEQRLFLQEKFQQGKITGRKEDPSKVAKEMPFVLKNGKLRFTRNEYLTSSQIASFFSRLSQKDRKGEAQDEEDFIAASADKKMFSLKNEVMSNMEN